MKTEPDGFEQSARIVAAFAQGEANDRVLTSLGQIAEAIRARPSDD
ncbi:hypothetical protein GO308_17805 [Sphingomonas sp. SFZ2018-12]|nr:hypothetical protein [Sphingomonas sp. SFZ2018-12]MCH4894961.1 hypothetical protein [Sphingomonas sp. SFZ2018-12]